MLKKKLNNQGRIMKHQHNKGKIKDNALKALVRSDLFKHKVFKNKKGKGSYNRTKNKAHYEPYLILSIKL